LAKAAGNFFPLPPAVGFDVEGSSTLASTLVSATGFAASEVFAVGTVVFFFAACIEKNCQFANRRNTKKL